MARLDGIRSIFGGKTTQELAKTPVLHASGRKEIMRTPEVLLDERLRRIGPTTRLELLYRLDPLVGGGVNKVVNDILGSDYYCKGPNAATFKDMLDRIEFKRALRPVLQDAFVLGRGFSQIVRNLAQTDVMKLYYTNAKYMDFQRDGQHDLILDNEGEPMGYTYSKVGSINTEGTKNLALSKVLHIKFFTVGGDPLGISPLEIAYNAVLFRLNLEAASAESTSSKGFPIPIGKIGDADHPPSKEAIDALADDLKNIKERTYFSFPYNYTLEWLDAPAIPDLDRQYAHFAQLFMTIMPLPASYFRTSTTRLSPEEVEDSKMNYEVAIMNYQDMLAEQVQNRLFPVFASMRNIPEDSIPTLKFRENSPTIRLNKARRLSILARSQLIFSDIEMENQLREEEGFKARVPEEEPKPKATKFPVNPQQMPKTPPQEVSA